MPAPFPLLDMPSGDRNNVFDFVAIHMAAAHNLFIQGVNAMVAHAPHVEGDKVQPFVIFAISSLEGIHRHHHHEETYYFEALETKLGKGYLDSTKEQHDTFVPQIDELEVWLRGVRDGTHVYDAKKMLSYIDAFADKMFEHLNEEVEKLDRETIRKHFTEQELKAIDAEFMKRATSGVDLYTALPLATICANPATPWFPAIPTPLKWANRIWFSRRYQESWEFGPLDLYGQPKALLSPVTQSS
ncbi:hypothetical protein CPB83DRAFT_858899 [Crepidotus variabilis]|uniref:Hemerythrin-like domain-containing protein n=1 Tax=Crepidotus variabilis TaxID=179855 RepID=A0A9P6EB33_9AGAR|nr:hypothetical protein CPB83DRAFT_858899 [Crepidotus variabilis]